MGLKPEGPKLNGQSVGKGSLSRGRGTGNHNKLLARILGNPLRNLPNLLFLQCLLHQNQIRSITVGNHVIQRAHRIHIHHLAPLAGLLQRLEQFGTILERPNPIRLPLIGHM